GKPQQKRNSLTAAKTSKVTSSAFAPPQKKITKSSSAGKSQHKGKTIMHASTIERCATVLKTQQNRKNGKNASTFESPSAVLKMKEQKITPVKDINPMINNMVLNGRCVSVWHSHKLNEEHDPYNLDYVIGTVVAIGNIVPVNGYGCSKIHRTVVIEDTESLRLECTFWDSFALMWNEYANKLDQVGHLDFVLILGKIKYWNNKLAIYNSLFGTRIFINKDIASLLSFPKSYEAQNEYNASAFRIGIQNQDNHTVSPAEFMQGSLKRMIGMIRTIEPETHCFVFATVHSIQYESEWAYIGCKACNSRVTAVASKGASSSRKKTTMTLLSAWEIMDKQGMDAEQYFLMN
ncbi:replication protein A 70 kDa DNA-binding subunit B, partial [Tanacetum coccineum]